METLAFARASAGAFASMAPGAAAYAAGTNPLPVDGAVSPITQADLSLLHALHDAIAYPALDAIVPAITALGNGGVLWLAVGIALLFSRKYRTWGVAVVAAVALEALLCNVLLKNIVARPRPFAVDPTLATTLIALPHDWSFPSGHTGCSFAAATAMCFIPARRTWMKALPLLAATAIAFTRLYLCVHYPTDVLGGVILGIVCGLAAGFALKTVSERHALAHGKEARGLGIDASS